ncbi:diacylglycerol kinase family protein [Pontibacter sp. G13]|uniref:diacylglycerol/lipid kinase family protein n=1 Tax=Pontibacter sp. G13 TaxID=3074898 RepID=UPI002889D637|nr:diacylglycerol kinase family protein [Pontibacter sp. G13]WNJ20848.1 diacylglycerol kinase family protein [Pontibacter sp. G13]
MTNVLLLIMSTLFLINPASGKKRNAPEIESLIRKVYGAANHPYQITYIDFSTLDDTLAQAIDQRVENIFAVGGDGTVNAIGTRLLNTSVNFGVIPSGSGNGYARNIGFSIRTKLAISQSLNAQVKKVDTGVFGGIPFLNVAGVGLDAEVAWNFSNGHRRGFAKYAQSSAESILSYQPENYTLTIDGNVQRFENIIGVAIANGTQWGYDAKVAPHARISDGYLDLLVVHKFPLIKVGFIVGMLFGGSLEQSKYVEVFRAKKIHIHRERDGMAQVDGEPFPSNREIDVEIKANSLNLLLPGTLTPEKVDAL